MTPAKTLVTGVIGSDTHIVGNRILSMALEKAGYKVVALGALTPAEEFVKAAVETAADAILVSSLYGQGELDCRGFRDLCVEAGLERHPDLRRRQPGRGQADVGGGGAALRRHGLRPRVPSGHADRRRDPHPGAGLRGARAGCVRAANRAPAATDESRAAHRFRQHVHQAARRRCRAGVDPRRRAGTVDRRHRHHDRHARGARGSRAPHRRAAVVRLSPGLFERRRRPAHGDGGARAGAHRRSGAAGGAWRRRAAGRQPSPTASPRRTCAASRRSRRTSCSWPGAPTAATARSSLHNADGARPKPRRLPDRARGQSRARWTSVATGLPAEG